MPKKTMLLGAAAACLLLAGCSQDQHILERIGYIRTVGYDAAEAGKVQITLSIPLVVNEANQSRSSDEVLTGEAYSSKEARNNLSRRISRNLVSGQARTILFSDRVAKGGLRRYMDTLMRDASISKRTEMVIVEGSAHEIISGDYPEHPRTAQYIDRLIKKEFKTQATPNIMLHQFLRDYYDDGKDPIATMLRQRGKDLEISGIALFQEDKYENKLEPKDIFYFSLMYGNLSKGETTLVVGIPEVESVTLNAINSKKKVRISRSADGKYRADIYIKLEGGLIEYNGNLKLSTSDRIKLEETLSGFISRQGQRVVKQLQQHRTDNLGIGQYVRNKMGYKAWKDAHWDDIYANMDIQVHAKLLIKNFGNYYD
ncbi:Ger(x)C family spore germination protein [Paenibacillus sp. M1]|uniref:Ger(X)C family spore germination protein n=1 Tax=Paenibacillus haidiansis TaxID=1574488 RepID=A0ABU7VWI7_9BACL